MENELFLLINIFIRIECEGFFLLINIDTTENAIYYYLFI